MAEVEPPFSPGFLYCC